MNDTTQSLIRNALLATGTTFLVGKGIIDNAALQQLVGGILALVALCLSLAKSHKTEALKPDAATDTTKAS